MPSSTPASARPRTARAKGGSKAETKHSIPMRAHCRTVGICPAKDEAGQATFRETYWLRTWALLQRDDMSLRPSSSALRLRLPRRPLRAHRHRSGSTCAYGRRSAPRAVVLARAQPRRRDAVLGEQPRRQDAGVRSRPAAAAAEGTPAPPRWRAWPHLDVLVAVLDAPPRRRSCPTPPREETRARGRAAAGRGGVRSEAAAAAAAAAAIEGVVAADAAEGAAAAGVDAAQAAATPAADREAGAARSCRALSSSSASSGWNPRGWNSSTPRTRQTAAESASRPGGGAREAAAASERPLPRRGTREKQWRR
ncbi:hypothetical protein U9M48_017489 [Paspalum notatum var. saurae]|uniref:Uncharacterized protein n=1 Tax=Paspalum notatum var. saurae TaxID=547442 RepID=A0AAQ3WNW6_PASNO